MIPIVFVRYAPGACGTFLLTLLQTSDRVACWNPDLEQLKGSPEFSQKFFEWFSHRFVSDLDNHIKHEPHHPYQLDFFSAKHPRGDNISSEEMYSLLADRQDQLFLDNIAKHKLTAMRLNKSTIPVFGYNNPVINIVIDPASHRWLNHTRWIKLFGKENNKWISKENHPEFLKAKFKNIQFKNQYHFDCTWREFAKNFIINEPVMQLFRNQDQLLQDPSNLHCPQHFVNLSTILNVDSGIAAVISLFAELNLGTPDLRLITQCYEHYRKTNLEPLSRFIR